MATRKQLSANRENGLKGGVKTEEGKAISRLNARKHGIFAVALTPEDSEEVYGTEDELIASLRPKGRVEEMLVEKLALTYLRVQRCARAEAELHVKTWREPDEELEPYAWERLEMERSCGGRGVPFREEEFERMVELIALYDGRLTNQFLKLLHEIQRQQRLRAAANDRAPESVPLRESSRAITEEEPAGLPAARLAGEDEPAGKPVGVEERGSDVKPQPAGAGGAPESSAARGSSSQPQPSSAVPPSDADDADIPAEAGTASHLERVSR
jgi:hypothetical protein